MGWSDGSPFLYSGGRMTVIDISSVGGTFGWARRVNEAGDVYGTVQTHWSSKQRAFIYRDGKYIDLGTAATPESMAFLAARRVIWDAADVNASGQIVGTRGVGPGPNTFSAYIYSDGKFTNLGSLYGGSSFGRGINDRGVVVGEVSLKGGGEAAALFQNGQVFDLNTLIPADSHFNLLEATAINNRGQIVGFGESPQGRGRAFLLTPVDVPEPGSLALLGLGAVGLAGYAWRRRGRPRTPAAA